MVFTPPPTLYDQFGRKGSDPNEVAFAPPKDPLASVSGDDVARWIYRDIPISSIASNWSIDAIRFALQDHKLGLFQSVSRLCDSIFGDDRVQATLGSRTGGLFSQPVHHRLGDGAFAKSARQAWRKTWARTCSQASMSEIMRWAIVLGFAIAEVLWDTTEPIWCAYLKPWHPEFATYRWDYRKFQLSTQDSTVAVVPGGGKWMLYAPHGPYRGWIQGVIRAIAEIWFIKRLAWRDWARFNERHGLPILLAEVPAAGDPKQKANFVNGMSQIGQQAVVGLPQNVDGTGYKLEMLEAKDRAWETFGNTIDRCDRSIVLPILWQNLTTEVKEGSLAAAREHGDVRQNAIQFDNATLSECIYSDVARPWALFNFGDTEAAPYTCWKVVPLEDHKAKADTFLAVAQGVNALRQAGCSVEDVRTLLMGLGIDPGLIAKVDPTSVEAKGAAPASAPFGTPSMGKSIKARQREIVREAKRAYIAFRAQLDDLDRRMAA